MRQIALAALIGMIAVPAHGASLTTTFESGNSGAGNMFDILIGAQDIKITGFDLNIFDSTDVDLEWYTLAGTYVGSETTAEDWTLTDSISDISSSGKDQATHWDVDDVIFSAGERYGFYLTTTNAAVLLYNNGTGIGNVAASDTALTIFEGSAAAAYPFKSIIANRIWNGTIYYETLGLAPVPLPAAGWLFLTALGGFGLIGRYGRRKVRSGA